VPAHLQAIFGGGTARTLRELEQAIEIAESAVEAGRKSTNDFE
jgi:hypothetical protein